ncbi:MAG TPA: glycosyltransferase [Nocardioidaceae bacterium]|nr:glycosyltransferase [Nocardioidaceae bacterium]
MPARIVAVVVTWNRRDLLRESLEAIAAQTLVPVQTVVVDNASDDGTEELLATGYPDLEVLRLEANTGGAGGFAAGIERALTFDPDLVWLLDDDTVPNPDAAAALATAWRGYGDKTGRHPSVLASRVVWTDGRDHPMNTPRMKPGASAAERAAAREVGCLPIRSASFVSIMCDAETIGERGLPIADYFLWNDDFEYSTRLIRRRAGLYCPESVVVHKTKVFGATDADPGERFFYEVRNKLWMFGRSTGLAPAEKVLYGGATARRWARTYARSKDRKTLTKAFRDGVRAGLTTEPRANADVLSAAGFELHRPSAEEMPATGEPEPFSLLLSTYGGDDPGFLRDAFVSTVQEQTRRPDEVVLVQDGPVSDELAETIRDLVATSPVPVKHVVMEDNVGLGPALDAGLEACAHEIVARMDADDVSRPDRFDRQLPLVEAGADIVGSGLLEFGATVDEVVGRRTPPTDPEEIRRVIRFRDPFNHPTVVYRKSAVLGAGGYTDMALMEDYLLFTRMIDAGARPANIAEPLVYYRVGAGAYARRGGKQLLRSELALQRRFRDLGITSRGEYVRNVAVRGGYRLVPEGVRKVAYRSLLANRGYKNRS